MFNKLFGKKTKEILKDVDSNGRINTRPSDINTSQSGADGGGDVGAGVSPPVFSPVSSAPIEETNPIPPVIGVLGAKGGAGASSIAVNLAVAMSITGTRTTLVDSNFQQPDAAQLVGIEPEHSLMELLHRMPFPDRQLFDACCAQLGTSGNHLNLLSPPIDGEAGLKANLSQLADCLKVIRCYSDFWVIDLPRHLDKHLVNLIDICDKIILVFEPSVSGVAACRRWLNIFNDLGYSKGHIICLLNRAGSKYTAVEQQLDDCFSDESIFRLPNASASAWECSTTGIPMVVAHPKHAYARAMFKLAQHINQPEIQATMPATLVPSI